MIWSRLNPSAAKRRFEELSAGDTFAPSELTPDYRRLREKLLLVIRPFEGEEDQKSAYDVETGLALYRTLNEAGFDVRDAADDGVWRHLSLNVLPDRVEHRWSHRPDERFWRSRSRIWLRAIWWLIHLAWQGSESATKAALTGMSTDMIVQLIERPGRHGFRVELARALFRQRSARHNSQSFFRALMKLNTARVVVVEPAFFEGGMQGYAGSLYAAIASTKSFTSTNRKK
jgi:hypothetical protein